MEKKYYDKIAALIKENEKYAGLEQILDDIVQDVYEHSKVILNSVTNEDVINAYLKKVASTSLITVPKKLNFKTKHRQRVINEVQAITGINIENKPEISFKEEEVRPLQIELTEEDLEPVSDITANELIIESSENIPDELIIEDTAEPLEGSELLDNSIANSAIGTDTTETLTAPEEDIDNLVVENEKSNELSLNDTAQTELIENNEEILEPLSQEIDSEIGVALDEEEINNVSLEEDTINDVIKDEKSDELSLNDTVQTELIENNEEVIEPLTQKTDAEIDVTLVDKMINGISSEEENVNDDIIETSLDEVENLDIDDNNIETDLLTVEEVEELDNTLEDDVEELIPLEENSDFADTEIKLPCYDCFNYEPENPVYDEEEICKALSEYNSKYSDKKIIEICNLKYKEKMPISQIAETLNMHEETVIETLNDIIEFVKDM